MFDQFYNYIYNYKLSNTNIVNNSNKTLNELSDSSKVDLPVIIPNKVKTADKTNNEPQIASPTEHRSSKVAIFYFAIANLSTFTNSFTNFLRTNVLFALCEKCTSLDTQDLIRIVITIKYFKLCQSVDWYSFHNFLWITFWHIPI